MGGAESVVSGKQIRLELGRPLDVQPGQRALGEGLDVALGFGTERGGKKCSGGVCYTEPEFAGLRLRLTKSF